MEAKELRIGNYLNHRLENKPHQIQTLSVNPSDKTQVLLLFGYIPECTLDFLEPITLTEEWLVRFGFIKFEYGDLYVLGSISLNLKGLFLIEADDGYNQKELDYNVLYVHQLQNLYFALTGTELEIKNP